MNVIKKRGPELQLYLFVTSALNKCGQLHAPAALTRTNGNQNELSSLYWPLRRSGGFGIRVTYNNYN